jgi:hypothetical protein
VLWAFRSLRVARASAIKARTKAIDALKGLLVTAPAELRAQLRGLPTVRLVQTTAALEPGPVTTLLAAAMLRLPTLARRYQALVGRAGGAGFRAGAADQNGRAQAAGAVWGRVGLGRGAAGGRRRQPRSAALQRGVLDAVRVLADRGRPRARPAGIG